MSKNKSNSTFLKIGVICVIVSLVCTGSAILLQNSNAKSNVGKEVVDTYTQAIDYLNKYSDIFTNVTLVEKKSLWPSENLIVDLRQKQLIYCKGTDSLKVQYKDVLNNYSCKQFVVSEESQLVSSFRGAVEECCALEPPFLAKYYTEIETNNSLSEEDKKLSKVYNIIVGDTIGHLVLGKANDRWKLYRLGDFPYKRIDPVKLCDYVNRHKNNPKLSPKECYNDFIVSDRELNIVYYNLRDKQVIEQNGKVKNESDNTLTHRLDLLKTYKGWINYKEVKQDVTIWKLETAYDYYVDSNHVFIDTKTDDASWLDKAEWKRINMVPLWLIIVLYSFGGVLLLCGCCMIVAYVKEDSKPEQETKKEGNEENGENGENKDIELTIIPPTTDESLEIEGLKKAIEEYKKQVDQLQKQVAELQQSNNELTVKIQKKEKEIKDAVSAALEKYKKEIDIENTLTRADNWKKLVEQTNGKKVFNILSQIRDRYKNFPELDTINSVYEKAKSESTDYRSLVHHLLEYIYREVDNKSDLTRQFDEQCKRADYAERVRVQYDATEKIFKQLAQSKELKAVLEKSKIKYWDRLAYALWAIDNFNKLLEIYKTGNLSQENLKSVKDNLQSDLIQQFATRIFLQHLEDGKSLDQYTSEANEMLMSRIAALENDYAIRYNIKSDSALADLEKQLDNVYDSIIGTSDFVNMMHANFVNEFYTKVEQNKDKAWFFEMMVEMGYHMVDFVRRRQGVHASLCPNYTYLLSNFDNKKLSSDAKFIHNDAEFSVEYTNRIYEWLDELGVQHLKALVGSQLIKP